MKRLLEFTMIVALTLMASNIAVAAADDCDDEPPKQGMLGLFGNAKPAASDKGAEAQRKKKTCPDSGKPCSDGQKAELEFFKFCSAQVSATRFHEDTFAGKHPDSSSESADEDFCRCLGRHYSLEKLANSNCKFKNQDIAMVRKLTNDEVRYDCKTTPTFLKQ